MEKKKKMPNSLGIKKAYDGQMRRLNKKMGFVDVWVNWLTFLASNE